MSTADLDSFANANGYMDSVYDPKDDTKTITNQETRVNFVKRTLVEDAVSRLAEQEENTIRVAKNKETFDLVEAKKKDLRTSVLAS